MEKFLLELNRLQETKGIKNDDFLLLRQLAFEKNYIQNITLNEESAFKDDTIEQIIEEIKLDIQKPLVLTIKEKEEIIDGLQASDNEKKERLIQLEQEKESERKLRISENIRIEEKTKITTNRIVHTYAPILFALFGFSTIILQIIPVLINWVSFVRVISGVIAIVSAVFIGFMKTNILRSREKLELKITEYYKVKEYKNQIKKNGKL